MGDCQMRVTCGACGYTTDQVYAVGGALLDGGVLEITAACPVSRTLVDGFAGLLGDFGVVGAEGQVRDLTKKDLDDAVEPVGAFMSHALCPACKADHEPWDAQVAPCPVCGAKGCRVEIARDHHVAV